jgi:lipoprotein-anchoring transpeptidase ErfK/SrfK
MTSNVSSGMRGYRTPTGKFVVTNKARHHTSSIYGSPMPYFQRLSCQAFGFHVGHCPGYPASHGCIRMPQSKARAFFSTTKVGDPVEIIP